MSKEPISYADLSAYLDQELTETQASEVQCFLGEHFTAVVDIRNMEALSRACKNLKQLPPSVDFEATLISRLDALSWAQENPAEDFEVLSAWRDGQKQDIPSLQMTPISEIHLSNIHLLSQLLQKLPLPGEIPADFHLRVIAALPPVSESTAEQEIFLRQALQALPVPEMSEDFMRRLEARLDQVDAVNAHNQTVLSQALQALPSFSPSANFMEHLLAQVENCVQEPSFEMLSVHVDHVEPLDTSIIDQDAVQTQLHNMRVLSAALRALPLPETSSDFFVRLQSRITQQEGSVGKIKILSWPILLRMRYVRMVAAIAAFGLLISLSQHILDSMSSLQKTETVTVIPTDHVIEVENQPEDFLFTELDSALDHMNDINYQIIGG